MAGSQSSLNDLPVEILRLIMGLLARKDLKALRKTNYNLHSVASETLFETIAITTNNASYIQLLNVAASKLWSAQVQHIDWVLLHGTGVNDSLAQRLEFNEPWLTILRKWRVYQVARSSYESSNVYPGLSLQCRLVQRLPNVQTVRFWSAVDSQRLGREPWEDGSTTSAAIATTKIIEGSFEIPDPEDVISILEFSNLRPRLIRTNAASMYMRFSTGNKYLKGVQILSHRNCGLNQSSPEQYRGAPAHMEKGFFPESMSYTASLAKSGVSSLTILRISGVRVLLSEMEDLLTANIKLQSLFLGQIELSADDSSEAMANFLLLLRDFHRQGDLQSLRVTFQKLRCQGLLGYFSATENEVRGWMEGESGVLLKTASSAFTLSGQESTESSNIDFDDIDQVKLETQHIEDMDSEDEEIGYFDVKERRHKKFERPCNSDEYKAMVAGHERMMGIHYDPMAAP